MVAARRARAAAVERQLCEIAAHLHAATAQVAGLAADFNELEGWCGDGLRSFAHWLTVNAGFAPHTGSELLRVGQALRELPLIREAFAAGRLSFDSVRELTRVATAADEAVWLDVAVAATGAQLARICKACRRVLDLDSREHADDQLGRRGLWSHVEDDGMISLRALLLPEEGALVLAAVEAAMRANQAVAVPDGDAIEAAANDGRAGAQPELALNGPDTVMGDTVPGDAMPGDSVTPAVDDVSPTNAVRVVSAEDAVPDPAELWPAQRADALVSLCEHVVAVNGGGLAADPATLPMLVHVDVGVLTGSDPDGRRHLDGGPALSLSTIQRLGCDASVITITEHDGIPVDVGRRQRIVPRGLRIAVQNRDQTCRFPACAVPAQRTHAHHLEHWAHDGPTVRDNIVSLCHFHHRRLHDGVFAIRGNPDADLVFETSEGRPIVRPPCEVDRDVGVAGLRAVLADGDKLNIDATTAGTPDMTARMDLGYVVTTVLDGVDDARTKRTRADDVA